MRVRVRVQGHGLGSFLGEGEKRRRIITAQAGKAGVGPGLSLPKASVDLATGLEGPLGGSAIDLNVGLRPGDDVPREGLGAAGGQVIHFPRGQLAVPDVEMGQLAHKCLCGIKPATQSVLWRRAGDEGGRVSQMIRGQVEGLPPGMSLGVCLSYLGLLCLSLVPFCFLALSLQPCIC